MQAPSEDLRRAAPAARRPSGQRVAVVGQPFDGVLARHEPVGVVERADVGEDMAAIGPLPLVVRSGVGSWQMTSSPFTVACTSRSSAVAPLARAVRSAYNVLDGVSLPPLMGAAEHLPFEPGIRIAPFHQDRQTGVRTLAAIGWPLPLRTRDHLPGTPSLTGRGRMLQEVIMAGRGRKV